MKLAYVTPSCCTHPSVAVMDHDIGWREDQREIVNRTCLHCGKHWYGNDGTNVVEFTRAAWDRWMASGIEA